MARITLVLVAAFLLGVVGSPSVVVAAGVVGDGTAASCTEGALVAAVASGGSISFNCGSGPVTITLTTPLDISAPETTIDGGGTITLSGGGSSRVIAHRTFGLIGSSTLTLKNLTIADGRASGSNGAANGGAISSVFQAAKPEFKPTLNLVNVTFLNNEANLTSFSGSGINAYDFGGGAVFSQGGALAVSGSTFRNNKATNAAGGAIHILQSALSIEGSTFENNSAIGSVPANSQGGAIYIDGLGGADGVARIVGSAFSGNTAYNSGGAIYVNMYQNSNQFVVDRSSFLNNGVVGGTGALGGAISGGSSTLGADSGNASITITGSTFAGNSVKKTAVSAQCGGSGPVTSIEDGSGGALAFAQRARIAIANSTFVENRAFGSCFNANGGALYVVNNSDQFTLTNTTFANNSAGWVGGAVSNSKVGGGPGGLVRNTIFWNNTADNGPNDWNIQQHCSSELASSNSLQFPGRLTGGNFFNDVTCFAGKSAPDQKDLPDFRDARLLALADNGGPTGTMAIPADSPARDAAEAASCPPTDQRGTARPQGGGCDIGAFELVVTLAASPSLVAANSDDLTLTVTGEGFTAASNVLWNGQERPTTFVNATTLRATIPAADLVATGDAQITVSGSSLAPATVRVVARITAVYLPVVLK